MLTGKVLITGGAGTLGRAIVGRAVEGKWDCEITIYSTDAVKHARVKAKYPQVQSVIGDIRQYETLYAAMTGKDVVIHAGAVKIIPVSEFNSIDTYQVNVDGSLNVAMAAAQLRTPQVLAISTDKACHAANAYGASKYLMEKIWQEYARLGLPTQYHLVRYGNVLESTASVVEAWKNAVEAGNPIQITDPEMTRFWLSPSQAVDYVIDSLQFENGQIYVPQMPALSIGKLAKYTVGDAESVTIPLRPGEKMHETLVTLEELPYTYKRDGYYLINPTTSTRLWDRKETEANYEPPFQPYASNTARELTKKELAELLRG